MLAARHVGQLSALGSCVHGSETSARVLVSAWLVEGVEGEVADLQHVPEVMYAPEQQAYSSLSKAEYFSAGPTPASWKRIHEAAMPACHAAAVVGTLPRVWQKHPLLS
jgi:hypothetical protein